PFGRQIPHAAFAEAFRDLARRVLVAGPDEVECWRKRLDQALGSEGAVITGIIPGLESVIGKQPPLRRLSPADATNRLHRVFRRFLAAVARTEKALVLFLDDAQWADSSSLSLLSNLLTHPDTRHVMVIAAYRNDE